MRIRFLRTEGFRLSAIYAGVFAVSVAALAMLMLFTTEEALRKQILAFSAMDIAAIRHGYASEGIPEAREVISQLRAAPNGRNFFLLQQDGKAVDGNLPAMAPQIGPVELAGMPATQGHALLGTGEWLAPGTYVFAGSDMGRLAALRSRMIGTVLWFTAAGLLLAIGGGALVSRAFLQRTDLMAKACRSIMDGDLSMRIPVRDTRDELDRLAEAINEMLGRINALMENLSQVSNDIAHDLRTPVTHLRHRLERARAECRSMDDHAVALDAAIAKADEILALFTALLRVAQIEGGTRRAAFAAVDLRALLARARDIFGAVAEESGHSLGTPACEAIVIKGDAALLLQLISNLVENAIVHTPPGTRIMLGLRRDAGLVHLVVSDDGPGVPPEEQDKIFRRLYRREASRTQPGYGLGLSMVAAIAELHGAKIEILQSREKGLALDIAFPLAAEPS